MFASLSLFALFGTLGLAALVIATAGTALTHAAAALSRVTGLGQAMFGAVFLGAVTSLPGIITTVVTAYNGYTDLAISNAVGGIAAQTFFLAVADVFYRSSNLEHASASLAAIVQATVLIAMLSVPLVVAELPLMEKSPVHFATPLLIVAYVFGMRLAQSAKRYPLWEPKKTKETVFEEEGRGKDDPESSILWLRFTLLALVVAVAGWVVAEVGPLIAEESGLPAVIVGALFTATVTSLPELVTTIAAARQQAPTLAVSDIIGGNSFDVLFLVGADLAFLKGSIYHQITGQHTFFIAVAMLMTAVFVLGMLRREKHGFANIGFESALLIIIYLGSVTALWQSS